jgi:hypothetical protein
MRLPHWLPSLLLAGLIGLGTPARADCPPEPQAPTREQLQAGLREARDRGLLWRIEKDGRTSWLYGTLHVGQMAWAFPGPKLAQALRQADTVALELDLSDANVVQDMQKGLARALQQEAQQPLPAELRERLATRAQAECVPAEALASQPALMQAIGLSMAAGRRDGLDPAFGQEMVLIGFARASSKRLVSLETPEIQLKELLPDDPAEVRKQLKSTLDELDSGQARRQIVALATLWAQGDLAGLSQWEGWCQCKAGDDDYRQLERMVGGRNPGIARAIAALHDQGQKVFAAVGALHMTGAQALPGLLQALGFTVERVAPDAR